MGWMGGSVIERRWLVQAIGIRVSHVTMEANHYVAHSPNSWYLLVEREAIE